MLVQRRIFRFSFSFMRFLFAIIICSLLALSTQGQDLTGTWEGNGQGLGTKYAKLVLMKCGDKWVGYSYDEGPGFCQANFEGYLDQASGKLVGENKGMIRKSPDHTQSAFELKFVSIGDDQYLRGIVKPKGTILPLFLFELGSAVSFRKSSDKVDTTAFMRSCIREENNIVQMERSSSQDPDRNKPASIPEIEAKKLERKNDTVAMIETAIEEITITLYDNGQIDGDTVTVFLNNKIVAERVGVTAKPHKITIKADRSARQHEIVFVANNLGSIPPNTAVVIIETAEKKYQLFASSDLMRNSLVLVKLKE